MTESPHNPIINKGTRIAKTDVSRRDFISIAWKTMLGISSVLGLVGLVRFFSFQTSPAPQTKFDLGPARELKRDSTIPVPEAQAVLIPDGQSFKAISLVCTHLGCLLEQGAAGYTCPCHGSVFSLNGVVQKGPADRPLREIKITEDENGHLILDTTEI